MSLTIVISRPEVTEAVTRGTARLWIALGWAPVAEFPLRNGRRADLLVWLDLPQSLVMRRVVRRTTQRRLRGTVLWNGNQEASLSSFFTDPDHIVRWAWRTRHANAARVADAVVSRADLRVVRLRSQREVDHWVDGPLCDSVSREPDTACHG